MSTIAGTPEPPYYAVIFTSLRTELDEAGYGERDYGLDDAFDSRSDRLSE